MRISDLREGLIKLPQQLLSSMQHEARQTLWSDWKVCLELSIDQEAHLAEWEAYGKKHQLVYDARVEDSSFVDFQHVDDGTDIAASNPQFPKLDPTLKARYNGQIPLVLRIVFNTDGQFKNPDSTRGSFAAMGSMYGEPKMLIRINARASALHGSPDRYGSAGIRSWWVTEYIDEAMGTVEHELTHYIQYFYLSHLDNRQVKGQSKGSSEDSNQYITSNIEFDPKIKSAIADFIKHTTGRPSTRDFAERVKNFVSASNYLSDGPNFGQNEFFWQLRKDDYDRWKKAVKLFVLNIRSAPQFKDVDYLQNFWMRAFSD